MSEPKRPTWIGAENKSFQRREEILNLANNVAADIEQCLRDWNKGLDNIYFLEDGKEKSLRNICSGIGVKEGSALNEEQLKKIFNDHLVEKAFSGNEAQKKVMLEHCEYFMHQGGYLGMLQSALFDAALDKNNVLSPEGGFDRRVVFSAAKGEISITETLKLKEICSLENREDPVVASASKDPLMVAVGKYSISFDEVSQQPRCTVKEVALKHNSEITKSLFEQPEVLVQENVPFNASP